MDALMSRSGNRRRRSEAKMKSHEMLGKAARVAVSKERTTMIATGDHSAEVGIAIDLLFPKWLP